MLCASRSVGLLLRRRAAPCKAASTTVLTRICTKGTNRRARSASAMPAPVSVTVTRKAIARFERVPPACGLELGPPAAADSFKFSLARDAILPLRLLRERPLCEPGSTIVERQQPQTSVQQRHRSAQPEREQVLVTPRLRVVPPAEDKLPERTASAASASVSTSTSTCTLMEPPAKENLHALLQQGERDEEKRFHKSKRNMGSNSRQSLSLRVGLSIPDADGHGLGSACSSARMSTHPTRLVRMLRMRCAAAIAATSGTRPRSRRWSRSDADADADADAGEASSSL